MRKPVTGNWDRSTVSLSLVFKWLVKAVTRIVTICEKTISCLHRASRKVEYAIAAQPMHNMAVWDSRDVAPQPQNEKDCFQLKYGVNHALYRILACRVRPLDRCTRMS